MKNKLLCASLVFILISTATAQINSENFEKLIGSQPSVEINLGSTMLGLLSSATEDEEGIAAILSALTAINVTVFELEQGDKNQSVNNDTRIKSIKSEISNLTKTKVSTGYEKIATIKEDDSLVYILAKMDKEKFSSLSIFALDDEDELVIIDIQGAILMSQIGQLMEHFDVDLELNSLELNKHKEK